MDAVAPHEEPDGHPVDGHDHELDETAVEAAVAGWRGLVRLGELS
jgi:hypothetical protein